MLRGVYAYHFDDEGQPRSRHDGGMVTTFVPTPGGIALAGRY